MRIAILGTGKMGGALAAVWARRGGHSVVLGSRTPAKAEALAAKLGGAGGEVRGGSIAHAADLCEVVVLATPWGATRAIIEAAGTLADKVVVDCTNPALAGSDMDTESGAERVARWAGGSRVVKAFNAVAAQVIGAPDDAFGGERATVPCCGDDAAAKRQTATLIEAAGFEAYDAGPLARARDLEALARIMLQLDRAAGRDTLVALRLPRCPRLPR